jgi:hypothetical protein
MKRLWLIQATGNALLFWLVFGWLGLRDAKTSQLIQTFVYGVLLLFPWLWLQDATLAYCADRSTGLWGAFRRALGTLGSFATVAIVFGLAFWALGRLEGPLAEAGQRTASWLTFHFRKPVKPQTWISIYLAILWFVRWVVLPVLVLPVASGVAQHGFRGIRVGASRVFWLQYLLASIVAFWLPPILMHWVPRLSGTTAQVVSFLLRFGLAYALIISAWLAVAFFSAQRANRQPLR